ncbi:ABC transporter substrate-binding protein [Cohnella sp. WQ 127256]|uniref:ABC transporter substrate-binding protein n=1 Tax=Cohnella sp. WQ 127256 TaxID=2938790 RepID=UPI00211936F3|nr:extracellular solute-binding protein [Cohnella sp. WQ 127256]
MNIKKIALLVTVTILWASLMVACGKGNTTESSQSPSNTPSTTDIKKEQVTLNFETWADKTITDKMIVEFEKTHTEITVIANYHTNFPEFMTSLKTAIATGDAPDIIPFDSPTSMGALESNLEPLDQYFEKDYNNDWKGKFLAGPVSDVSINGKIVGFPGFSSPGGLIWYNKNLLDKYGIKVPETYDELKAASDMLRKNGLQPLLLGAKDSWIVLDTFQEILNDVAPGKQYDAFAKKIPFNDPEIVKAFDTWKKLFDDKIFQDDTFSMTQYMDVYNSFVDKQVGAFQSNGAWNQDIFSNNDLKAKVDAVEWGVMSFPDLNGDGKRAPLLNTVGGIGIYKKSKNKDAAWEFIKFMNTGIGAQLQIDRALVTPPFTDPAMGPSIQLTPNQKQVNETINQIVKDNGTLPRGVADPKVTEKLYDVLTKVAYGNLSSANAAKQVQDVIDSSK